MGELIENGTKDPLKVNDIEAKILRLEAETRRAHDRMEAHEKLTAEKLSGLREQVRTVRGEVLQAISAIRDDMDQLRIDLRALFQRFWVIAGSTILITLAALGALFLFTLNRLTG